jgi:hypothetical protein
MLGLVNVIIPILAGVALAIFFWGIVRYVYSAGEEGHTQGRQLFMWGLVGLFVLFCVYGIVQLICSGLIGSSCQGSNSTGVEGYFGSAPYQNTNPFGGPR